VRIASEIAMAATSPIFPFRYCRLQWRERDRREDDHATSKDAKTVRASVRIVKTAGVCGGDARICGTRIPVWGIEKARMAGISVDTILEDYPSLTLDDVLAALEYAASHPAEIAQQIAENEQ
jgi:uncharacterized protein (DUF433 family)